MTSHVEGVVAQLPKMTPADLMKVRQLTDMLLGSNVAKLDDPTEQMFFNAVKAELAIAGIRNSISFNSFAESKYYKSWQRGIKVVSEFIDESFKDEAKTEVQRLGLCRILIQTMIGEFKDRGIPVSLGSVANNLHRIPQTFDRAFPNYLQSGLAYLVPRALLRNRA